MVNGSVEPCQGSRSQTVFEGAAPSVKYRYSKLETLNAAIGCEATMNKQGSLILEKTQSVGSQASDKVEDAALNGSESVKKISCKYYRRVRLTGDTLVAGCGAGERCTFRHLPSDEEEEMVLEKCL